MRDTFNQTYQQSGESSTRAASAKKKKKIDPNVGEYVAFEEIACNVTTESGDSNGNTRFRSESQVEDAVWEDIKTVPNNEK